MSSVTTMVDDQVDFSLVSGGLLYRCMVRCGLERPPVQLLGRRIVAMVVVAWLPLCILSLLDGTAFHGVEVPLFRDLSTTVRFLIALPLLLSAEPIVHERMKAIVAQFSERGLIAPSQRERFDQALASAIRWRNSSIDEVVIFVIAFTVGYWIWRSNAALNVSTWYAKPVNGSLQFTPAGYWYVFLSLPLFRFILFRWYFRFVIWYRLLWKISKLDLQLNALHPDRAGGLGFLGISPSAFVMVLIAHTILVAGVIGDRILHEGSKLPQFRIEIISIVISLLVLAYLPLCFFLRQLYTARLDALRRYGLVAVQYVNNFRQKWMTSGQPAGEPMLGAGDFQSLADLGNSFQVVQEMRMIPFGKQDVIRSTIMIAVPLAPLMLTVFPMREMVDRAFKMLL